MNSVLEGQSQDRRLYGCLQSIQFLLRLNPAELDELVRVMSKRFVPAGATVYLQGSKADAFYFVSAGRLNVVQKRGFRSQAIARLGPGQYFGDNSLLTDGTHQCSVVAEVSCELYVLRKEDFERILMSNLEIRMAIQAHVAKIRTGHPLQGTA